jgi:hypothetical protein
MPEFPAITHVALTVSDLGRSRPWYQRLFGSDPVIDEDTGPFQVLGDNLGPVFGMELKGHVQSGSLARNILRCGIQRKGSRNKTADGRYKISFCAHISFPMLYAPCDSPEGFK